MLGDNGLQGGNGLWPMGWGTTGLEDQEVLGGLVDLFCREKSGLRNYDWGTVGGGTVI